MLDAAHRILDLVSLADVSNPIKNITAPENMTFTRLYSTEKPHLPPTQLYYVVQSSLFC